ncbi:MAG: AAC(3) family N-acetyltransferase [Armatimonadetes bacterium]|nr:AAC(3) family N-acetyltransferase [Armatimonadota bacterium]NCO94344.1 AAC(3) family N-acetyltransferase [Armatimonadota bacterium]NDK15583.1 AAC(3) family N-acetyltransferase [Armatimonadota bacterium]
MASVTTAEIVEGLRRLGVERGMKLMVHSSLRSFGHVDGGAEAVIAALVDAVGPDGTLMMPSFNHGAPFKAGGANLYDPLETPTVDGKIPDTFWRMPGVLRSLDPTHAYAVWGADAERYTREHHLTLTMGEDSPLGLLAREGGYQLNLGTSHHTTTAKHVAEMWRRTPCLGLRTEAYPGRMPDGSVQLLRTWGWRKQSCPLTESGEYIEAEMERLNMQHKTQIGAATVTLLKLTDCLEAIWGLLDNGHAGHPPCSQCPIRPRTCEWTVESDWDEERRRPRNG